MNQFQPHNGRLFMPVDPTTIVEVTCVIKYRPTWWERLFFKQTQPTVTAPACCIIWPLVAEYRIVSTIKFTPPSYLKLVK